VFDFHHEKKVIKLSEINQAQKDKYFLFSLLYGK
jgi:hypothetical protein